jgi:hypothetical protein
MTLARVTRATCRNEVRREVGATSADRDAVVDGVCDRTAVVTLAPVKGYALKGSKTILPTGG